MANMDGKRRRSYNTIKRERAFPLLNKHKRNLLSTQNNFYHSFNSRCVCCSLWDVRDWRVREYEHNRAHFCEIISKSNNEFFCVCVVKRSFRNPKSQLVPQPRISTDDDDNTHTHIKNRRKRQNFLHKYLNFCSFAWIIFLCVRFFLCCHRQRY